MSKIYAYIWGKERKNNYIEFLDDKIIISANVASTRVSECQYDEIRYEDIVDFGQSLETLGYTIRGLMLEYCQWGLCEVIRRYEYAFVLNNGKCIPFEARHYFARRFKRIRELILERSMQGKCIMSNRPRKYFVRALLLTITEIFLYFVMNNVENSFFLFVVWVILLSYIIGLYAYAWLAVDDYINITPEYMNAVVSSTEYPFYYREAKKVREAERAGKPYFELKMKLNKVEDIASAVSETTSYLQTSDESKRRNMLISDLLKENYFISQVDKYIYQYDANEGKGYFLGDFGKSVDNLWKVMTEY